MEKSLADKPKSLKPKITAKGEEPGHDGIKAGLKVGVYGSIRRIRMKISGYTAVYVRSHGPRPHNFSQKNVKSTYVLAQSVKKIIK